MRTVIIDGCPFTVVTGITVKRATDDGMFELEDHVELGKEYEFIWESITTMSGYNTEHKKYWFGRPMIISTNGGALPLEMIEILDPPTIN